MIYPIVIILFVGVLLIPFGMPVFTLKSYLKNDYVYENREVVNGGQFNIRFDERYSKEKWAITLKELESVYDSIPDKEKENTIIWGKHYAQARAVNLFKEQYNLPRAYSLHGSFFNWVPKGEMPNVTIALSYNAGDFFQGYFDEVVKVKTIYNPYSENEELQIKNLLLKKFLSDIYKVNDKILDEYISYWAECSIPKKTIITECGKTERYLYFVKDGT